MKTIEVERRSDGWWITGVPEAPDCGPYETREEAEADRRGMERFLRFGDRPGFVTTDRSRSAPGQ